MEYNYYDILGIKKNATYIEIKQKYYNLALKFHPDKNIHLEKEEYLKRENEFKIINRAFSILSDPIEREKYDKLLDSNKSEPNFYSYYFGNLSFNISPVVLKMMNKIFSDEKIQNIQNFISLFTKFINLNYNNSDDLMYNVNFVNIIKNFKDFYQDKNKIRKEPEIRKESEIINESRVIQNNNNNYNFSKINYQSNGNQNGNQNAHQNNLTKGKLGDLIYNINVSLSDIYNETPKELNVPRIRLCNFCLGRGYLGCDEEMSLCHICNGVMKIVDNKVFPIDIRKEKIIFKSEGHQEDGCYPNDLIININAKPDSRFEKTNKYDLLYNHSVYLLELYTELNIHLIHLDNKEYLIKCNIDITNQKKILNQMSLRIRDLGLPINDSGRRGDLYIKLLIKLPELSKTEIRKLKNLLVFNPKENESSSSNENQNSINISLNDF